MKLKTLKKQRKNIDLSEDCIKRLSKIAIDKHSNFKNLAQCILENYCEESEQSKGKEQSK